MEENSKASYDNDLENKPVKVEQKKLSTEDIKHFQTYTLPLPRSRSPSPEPANKNSVEEHKLKGRSSKSLKIESHSSSSKNFRYSSQTFNGHKRHKSSKHKSKSSLFTFSEFPPNGNHLPELTKTETNQSPVLSPNPRASHSIFNFYNDIPRTSVISCHVGGSVLCLCGPRHEEKDEIIISSIVSANSVSTYPHLPENPQREGHPICDVYKLIIYPNAVIAAMADGCNWGQRSLEAARRAANAFTKYLESKMIEIRDVNDAGHFLLRGFETASREIIHDKREIWDAGTTTLLGGILLQLEENKWGFLCANVGDCKAFLWSKASNQVVDITRGNRMNLTDPRDPGGRLGPHGEGGRPDLRNLKLYFIECFTKDLIFIASDGVHDNYDPQTLGQTPQEFKLNATSWEEAEKQFPDECQNVKSEFMEKKVFQTITRNGRSQPKPKTVTRRLTKACWDLTKNSRDWMESHPTKKLPVDYQNFPGKMDHSTCCCFQVGVWSGESLDSRRKSL